MKPTIGRIVNYKTGPEDKVKMSAASAINGGCNVSSSCPAIITAVWSDTAVNLRVIADGNLDLWKTSIQEGDAPGNWSWPVKE